MPQLPAGAKRRPLRDKLRAFFIHLAISGCVVGGVGGLMLLSWYPQPWFQHDGGWTVYRLILLVDVVLGPLLTFIVYTRGKPELRRDLSVIAAVQLGALAFGITTMLQHRPLFVVYAENNFFTVTRKEVREGTQDWDRLESLRQAAKEGELPLVFQQLPSDPARRAELRAAHDGGGTPVIARGDYYQPMSEEHWATVLRNDTDIENLARQDADIRAELERFRARHPQPLQSFIFLPVVCRNTVLMLVLDRAGKTLVDWMG